MTHNIPVILGMDVAHHVDMTVLTMNHPAPLHIGDLILMPKQTNRERTRVVDLISECCVQINTFRRPSRGFARHVRRMKQVRRISGLPRL